MATVIPFRRGDQEPQRQAAKDSHKKALAHARTAASMAGRGVFAVARYLLFIVLLTIRRPILFVLNCLAGISMLGFPMILFGWHGHDKALFLWLLGGMFLGGGLFSWLYDSLLLRLSPEPIILT